MAKDPRQKFLEEAAKHVGPNGHDWVKSKTDIGNQFWCAATMCAVAKATGFAGKIMPSKEYTASGFGKKIVTEYGGKYIKGGRYGSKECPQPGDIMELQHSDHSGTYGNGTQYASYHVGVVEYVKGSTVHTIEGNCSKTYKRNTRSLSTIGWYARPNWSKVGQLDPNFAPTTSISVEGYENGGEYAPINVTIDASSLTYESILAYGFAGTTIYDSTSTRADAMIREVCYMAEDGEPSIKQTGIKLSVINYTTMFGSIISQLVGSGFTGGSGMTDDNIDKLPSVPRTIVEYLKNKGLCTAAAIGIVANIHQETGGTFDTSAVGDHGTSFGICQWHNERGTAMKKMAGSNWASNLSGQLDYLWYELNHSYKSTVLDPIKKVKNTKEGAEKAAEIFTRHFEKPANVDQKVKERKELADKYWSKVIVGSYAKVKSGTVTKKSGKEVTEGKTITVPKSVIDKHYILANYTSYSKFYSRWTKNTMERKLADDWNKGGRKHNNYVAMIDGYYLVALAPKFGECGDIVKIILTNGVSFNAIIADIKGSDKTSNWGHVLSGVIDIIEWESYGDDQSKLISGLKSWGVYHKQVSKIINYGSYY